jgi:hypothetical protein
MATSHVLTLCEVIQAVSEVAAHDQETLATVVHLISSGQVRLSADAIKALRELSVPTNAAASGRGGTSPLPQRFGTMTCREGAAARLTVDADLLQAARPQARCGSPPAWPAARRSAAQYGPVRPGHAAQDGVG